MKVPRRNDHAPSVLEARRRVFEEARRRERELPFDEWHTRESRDAWFARYDELETDLRDVEAGFPIRYPIDLLDAATLGMEEHIRRMRRAEAL